MWRRVKLIPMWHQWPETNRQSGDFMLWPRYRDGNRPVTRGNPLAASFGALIHKRGDIPAAWWSNGGEGEREREGEKAVKNSEGKPGERNREKEAKGCEKGRGRERKKRTGALSLCTTPRVFLQGSPWRCFVIVMGWEFALGGAHLSPTLVGDTCFNDYPPRQREENVKGGNETRLSLSCTSNYAYRRKHILLGIIPSPPSNRSFFVLRRTVNNLKASSFA